MSRVSLLFAGRPVRIGLLAVVTALVVVPTVARARQQIDRREATRLSIKHSWVGIAPPTKASVTPTQVAVLPAPIVRIETGRVGLHVPLVWNAAPRSIRHESSDPLRGPPSHLS
jgi:hypothetical protein